MVKVMVLHCGSGVELSQNTATPASQSGNDYSAMALRDIIASLPKNHLQCIISFTGDTQSGVGVYHAIITLQPGIVGIIKKSSPT